MVPASSKPHEPILNNLDATALALRASLDKSRPQHQARARWQWTWVDSRFGGFGRGGHGGHGRDDGEKIGFNCAWSWRIGASIGRPARAKESRMSKHALRLAIALASSPCLRWKW